MKLALLLFFTALSSKAIGHERGHAGNGGYAIRCNGGPWMIYDYYYATKVETLKDIRNGRTEIIDTEGLTIDEVDNLVFWSLLQKFPDQLKERLLRIFKKHREIDEWPLVDLSDQNPNDRGEDYQAPCVNPEFRLAASRRDDIVKLDREIGIELMQKKQYAQLSALKWHERFAALFNNSDTSDVRNLIRAFFRRDLSEVRRLVVENLGDIYAPYDGYASFNKIDPQSRIPGDEILVKNLPADSRIYVFDKNLQIPENKWRFATKSIYGSIDNANFSFKEKLHFNFKIGPTVFRTVSRVKHFQDDGCVRWDTGPGKPPKCIRKPIYMNFELDTHLSKSFL